LLKESIMRIRHIRAFPLALLVWLAVPESGHAQVEIQSADFGGLRARAIGPAVMSGRISSIDAFPEDPLTIWVGTSGGGVWMSDDAGVTFSPVFDDHIQSIGAVRIDPSDKNTVWVGTGETWTRNSVSVGAGVFRTSDAGESWDLMGLEDTERIAQIVVDPTDSNRVFVCATGHLWDSNEERGVFRTTNGGETWEKILYVDDSTGCSDLDMDPHAPTILYAGMWQFRRWPYFFESGGPGSGLYRSVDGGDTWEELTNGLPEGDKGRIAISIAASQPNIVYAHVEAENSGLFRTNDMGASWEEVNTGGSFQQRPFYFSLINVDPTDPDRIYKPGYSLTYSSDGGRAFTSAFSEGFGGAVHPDHHAFWINPNNPNELLIGTDGGVYISYDRAQSWRMVQGLPVSQFYEVSYDMEFPYNVYGGLQDNGTWMGPSRSPGGIENKDWKNIAAGDGFHAFVDPTDPDFVYAESQGGNLMRHRKSIGETKQITPFPEEGDPEFRWNWNSPIHLSANDPATLYAGSQYVLRSRDRGDSWERISPDLTTNDPEKQKQEESGGLTTDATTAENHTTVYSISESPVDASVIWAGTDDGNLQITRDGGATWTNVVGNTGVPANTWVSHVEASSHDAGTAFVTFDGHRTGDMTTYVLVTTDFGETWISVVTEQVDGYAHVIKQDPVNPDLLFLGTEFGLYISLDGGTNWARYSADAGGLPPVAVRDLTIHPREQDLIIATHGRGIYILDDITPLRHITQEVLDSDLTVLPTRPAFMLPATQVQQFPGNGEYYGPNPAEAASIVYYQKRRHLFGDMKAEIYDADGELITEIPAGKRRGLNRVEWMMRLPAPKLPPASSLVFAFAGPRMPEGDYTVRIQKGDDAFEGTVSLAPDPRSPHSAADRALGQETSMRMYVMLESLAYAVEAVIDLRDKANLAADSTQDGRAESRLREYAESLDEFRTDLVSASDEGLFAGEEMLREKLGNLFGAVSMYDGRPTGSQITRVDVLAGQFEEAQARFEQLVGPDLDELNEYLVGREQAPLDLMTREAWETEAEGG
jgi:photosystem II stability/assembly factor-like uncharacterized protein